MRTGSQAILAAMLCIALNGPTRAFAGPALLFDPTDGKIFYAEDQDDQWHPASLTKIMTAYLTFEAIRAGKITLEQKIPCSEAAFAQPPSKVGLPVGAEMTVETALQALVVKSANDVAVMLAEAVGGTEQGFVDTMNAKAQQLGMSRTKYVNANGLPAAEQITTARDLARLSMAVLRDFPEYNELWARSDMKIGKRRLSTHNGLLKTYEGADGLKTGFTCNSGFNVVASATREGHRLLAVVLGESSGHSRSVRAENLLEHGFESRDWKAMLGASTLDTMPIPADSKPVTSVRNTIISWDCGGRRPPRVARAKHKAPKTAAASAANAPAEGSAPAASAKAASPQGGAAAPSQSVAKAKPKPAAKAANAQGVQPAAKAQ